MLSKLNRWLVYLIIAVLVIGVVLTLPLRSVWIEGTYSVSSTGKGNCSAKAKDGMAGVFLEVSSVASPAIQGTPDGSRLPLPARLSISCSFNLLNPKNSSGVAHPVTAMFSFPAPPLDLSTPGVTVIKDFAKDFFGDFVDKAVVGERVHAYVSFDGGQFSSEHYKYRAQRGWIVLHQKDGRITSMKYHLLLKATNASLF